METLARAANRGSISTGYDIDNSLKFEADNSERIRRNQTTGTNRKKFTVSFWVKRTEITSTYMVLAIAEASGNDISFLDFEADDVLRFRDTVSASNQCILETNRVFRDTSAWYHIVLRVDTTLSTADDRARIYVNGVQETSFSTRTNFDQNDDTFWGYNGGKLTWGNALAEANYFSGYVADAYYIDGQSLAPTEFGEFDADSGIWKPIDASGLTFGNNGYYLDFKDSSNLGNDASGGTDFTLTNITAADQATDTPTNNFCIGNALVNFAPGGQTLTEGGTKFANPSSQNWQSITGTFGLTSGKWYWEFKTNGTGAFVGVSDVEDDIIPQNTGGYFLGYGDDDSSTTNSLGMYSANGVIYNDNTGATGASYGTSDIVGVALDMDNEKIYFAVNNTYVNSGNPASGTNGAAWNSAWTDTVHPAFSCAQNNNVAVNYGGYTTMSISSAASDANGYGTFEYAPPSGYYALCTKNLAEYG